MPSLDHVAIDPRRLFAIFDANHDKKVDVDEFMAGFALLGKGSVEEKLKLTFTAWNKDQSGKMTKAEMYSILKECYCRSLQIAQTHHEEVGGVLDSLGCVWFLVSA